MTHGGGQLTLFGKAPAAKPRTRRKHRLAEIALTPSTRRDVVGTDDNAAWCRYCGFIATEVDHVVPRARGGGNHPDNWAPACFECNHQKRDLTPDEWAATRRAEGKPWPIPSFSDRLVFLFRMGIRPKYEKAGYRLVIQNYEEYRSLLVALRDHDLAELE